MDPLISENGGGSPTRQAIAVDANLCAVDVQHALLKVDDLSLI
jgi:hypothetical protein